MNESSRAPERAPRIEPWPRGRCEYVVGYVGAILGTGYCGKRGRWMVNGAIRCGEHRDQ